MDNVYDNINELYTKGGFLERYGKDVLITLFIFLVFFITFSYFLVMNNLKPIKENWTKERCNPSVMPFAGLINAPPGASKFDYTSENFNGCLNSILKSIINRVFAPIYYVMNVFTSFFKVTIDSLQHIRKIFDTMRTSLSSTSNEIYGRSMNVTVPVIQLFINIKDMLSKTQGVMSTALFSVFGGYLGLKSVIAWSVDLTISIIMSIVAFIIFLWVVPFTWGVAASLTTVTIPLIALLGVVASKTNRILKSSPSRGLPKKPRCFDENTVVTLHDDSSKFIKNLKVGEILIDGSKITGIMKSSTEDHTFYYLNGITVTGTHRVYHKDMGWILVKEHPDSIFIKNYFKKTMYCVGTSSKLLLLDDIIFGDWDELDNNNIVELYANTRHVLPDYFMREHIHKYLDGGFIDGTEIELKNGTLVKIENVKINDILKNGEKVLTTVKLDAKDLVGVYEYHIGTKVIKGGPNLEIMDENLGTIDTTKIKGKKIKTTSRIYNLVTDTETFYVNGIRFCDYNSTTDKYLKDRKFKT